MRSFKYLRSEALIEQELVDVDVIRDCFVAHLVLLEMKKGQKYWCVRVSPIGISEKHNTLLQDK
ncbi:MAG: hypothetical protein UW70_C0095G0009, partial [Candidatus Peregrinibacteria bacterium GW2011_GWA2_44_7]